MVQIDSKLLCVTICEAMQFHRPYQKILIEVTKIIFILFPVLGEVNLRWNVALLTECHSLPPAVCLHVTPSLHHWELCGGQQECLAVLVTHISDFIHTRFSRVGLQHCCSSFYLQWYEKFFKLETKQHITYVPAKYTYFTLSSAVYWSTLILVVSSPDSSHRMLLPGTVPWLWEPHWEQLGSWLCSCSVGEHCHQTLVQPLAEQLNTSADTFQKVAFERIFASTKHFLVLSSVLW